MTGPPQPSPAAGGVVPAPRSGPPALGVGVPPPARKSRNRKLRLWLAMGAGILTLLCVGGIGVFISLYDEATEIQRSEPDAVVDGYLRAFLMNRDDKETALFTCSSGAALGSMTTLRDEFKQREDEFGVSVVVTWTALVVSGSGDTRDVATDLTIAGTSNGQVRSRRTESWTLGLVDQNGWRVCSAEKVA